MRFGDATRPSECNHALELFMTTPAYAQSESLGDFWHRSDGLKGHLGTKNELQDSTGVPASRHQRALRHAGFPTISAHWGTSIETCVAPAQFEKGVALWANISN